MGRALLLALVALLSFAGCGSSGGGAAGTRLVGPGLTLELPSGWSGRAAPGQIQAADFPLARPALLSPEQARVQRGHVHLIVWDYGPAVPYLGNFRPLAPPLALRIGDVTAAPLEGFPADHRYAVRSVETDGELLELVADLGPTQNVRERLRAVNSVLATLRVRAPRLVLPRGGRLDADGIGLRLLRGWSGRIELPTDHHSVELVLRARRGGTRLVVIENPGAQGRHVDLPVRLRRRDVIRSRSGPLARLVFTSAGRSFDLSVRLASPRALAETNRLLRTLTAGPRPWTFRSCDLALRLPGTWRVAVNPRSGCRPVLTLRTRGVRAVLAELRPGERAAGRVLRRAGRRFALRVAPASALRRVELLLTGLRATRS